MRFNTARTYFLSYNLNKPYLQDANVRKALIYAINKEEIVNDALMGIGGVPNGIFMDDVAWANLDVDTYEYDIEKAKAMLADAGYTDSDGDNYLDKDGEQLTISIITGSRRPGNPLIVQAVQGYYENIGVSTTVDVLDGNAYTERVTNSDYDLALSSAATGYVPSPSYYLSTYYHSSGTNATQNGYRNAELDALIDQCKAELDLSKRIELSKQAQAIAQDDAAVYTIAHYGAVFVLDKNLQNFAYSAAVHDFIVPYETNISQ